MKNLIKYAFVLMAFATLSSCLVDDSIESDSYGDSVNTVGFDSDAKNANIAADGEVHPYPLNFQVTGPTASNISGDVTATFSVDVANSTAIAGVHYEAFTQSSIVINSSTNMLASMNLNVITDGIVPPLAESPYLILNIDSVSGGGNVLINGRANQIKITINYLCFSDLAGEYVINYTTGPQPINIVETAAGVYEVDVFPLFTTPYYWTLEDVCGVLTITDWQFQASNPLSGATTPMPTGTVDPVTGDITFTGVTVAGAGYDNQSWTLIKVN